LHVLIPIFGGGELPELLDRRYKMRPTADHLAKFHVDRPTHVGNLALKEKKISAVKRKSAPKTIASGQTNSINQSINQSINPV